MDTAEVIHIVAYTSMGYGSGGWDSGWNINFIRNGEIVHHTRGLMSWINYRKLVEGLSFNVQVHEFFDHRGEREKWEACLAELQTKG